MKNLISCFVILLLMACSTPEQRKQAVENKGFEVVYQNSTNADVNDFFIAVKDKTIYYVEVDCESNITKIMSIVNMDKCKVLVVETDEIEEKYENKPIVDSDRY